MKPTETYQFFGYRAAMTTADTIAGLIDRETAKGNPVEWLQSELMRQWNYALCAAVDFRENAAAYGVNYNRDETIERG